MRWWRRRSSGPMSGAANCRGELFYDDGLDGAFVGGLLDGVLEFRWDFIDNDSCHFRAHLENVGAGVDAELAGGACVFDSCFHNLSPLKFCIFFNLRW